MHSVRPPPLSAPEGSVGPPTKFSKRRGLTGSQFLEGVAEKDGVTLFQRVVAVFK